MQKNNYKWIVYVGLFILALQVSLAGNSTNMSNMNLILTGSLSPVSQKICGNYTDYVNISASGIFNNGTLNLTDVSAMLIMPSQGLSLLTDLSVSLGNIQAKNYSSISPHWILACEKGYPGNYTLYVNYSSSEGAYGSSLYQSLDSNIEVLPIEEPEKELPPVITGHSPVDVVKEKSFELKVFTNKSAVCRYSTVSGQGFDSMPYSFDTTGGLTHVKLITGIGQGAYHYYVRCKDYNGNKMNEDYSILVEVDLPPTAKVIMSKPSPVKAGIIKVTLETSEDVVYAPTLKYSITGKGTENIPLSGSGKKWEGYMIIEDDDSDKIGSFIFQGKDLNGNIGTTITNDHVFLIDTLAPSAPSSIEAESKKGGIIKVSWWYNDNASVKHYRLYRSTSPGVSKVHLYKELDNDYYEDTDTEIGTTYYYRVLVVDNADNEGQLSKEVNATALKDPEEFLKEKLAAEEAEKEKNKLSNEANETSETEANENKPDDRQKRELITKLADYITEVDNINIEFDENMKLVEPEIKKQMREGKIKLMNLRRDVDKTEPDDLTKLKIIEKKVDESLADIPVKVDQISSKDHEYSLKEQDLLDKAARLLDEKNIEYNEKKLKKFVSKLAKAQNSVEGIFSAYEITYMDDSKKTITIITKNIEFDESFGEDSKLYVVEELPQNIDVKDISFNDLYKKIDDTHVLFEFKKGNLDSNAIELTYIIHDKVSFASLEEAKTVVVPSLDEFNKKSSSITGMAITETVKQNFNLYNLLLAIGILTSLGLIIYLVKDDISIPHIKIPAYFSSLASKIGFNKAKNNKKNKKGGSKRNSLKKKTKPKNKEKSGPKNQKPKNQKIQNQKSKKRVKKNE